MSVQGSCLGLYALKVVVDTHDFKIKVRSIVQEQIPSKPAKNIFTISIH
jgi:hypothetical protein